MRTRGDHEESELKYFNAYFLSTEHKHKIARFVLSSKRLRNALYEYYADVYPNQPSSAWLKMAVKSSQKLIRKELGKSATSAEARASLLRALASAACQNLESAYEELFNPMFTAILTTAQIRAEIDFQQSLGLPKTSSSAQVKKEIDIWRHVKTFLGFRTGGDRRRPNAYRWNDDKRKQFAQTVQQLPKINGLELWEYITKFFHQQNYDPQSIVMLSARLEIKNVPPDLLRLALDQRRKYCASATKTPRMFGPQAFALQHARIILGIPESKYDSLKSQYYAGRKLLSDMKVL
jgi:hypothetical protein